MISFGVEFGFSQLETSVSHRHRRSATLHVRADSFAIQSYFSLLVSEASFVHGIPFHRSRARIDSLPRSNDRSCKHRIQKLLWHEAISRLVVCVEIKCSGSACSFVWSKIWRPRMCWMIPRHANGSLVYLPPAEKAVQEFSSVSNQTSEPIKPFR